MLYVNMLYICCLLRDFNVGQKRITYSTGLGDRLPTNWHNLTMGAQMYQWVWEEWRNGCEGALKTFYIGTSDIPI